MNYAADLRAEATETTSGEFSECCMHRIRVKSWIPWQRTSRELKVKKTNKNQPQVLKCSLRSNLWSPLWRGETIALVVGYLATRFGHLCYLLEKVSLNISCTNFGGFPSRDHIYLWITSTMCWAREIQIARVKIAGSSRARFSGFERTWVLIMRQD